MNDVNRMIHREAAAAVAIAHLMMEEEEWSADTLDDIARVLREHRVSDTAPGCGCFVVAGAECPHHTGEDEDEDQETDWVGVFDRINGDDPDDVSGGDYPAYLDSGGVLDRDDWERAGYPTVPVDDPGPARREVIDLTWVPDGGWDVLVAEFNRINFGVPR